MLFATGDAARAGRRRWTTCSTTRRCAAELVAARRARRSPRTTGRSSPPQVLRVYELAIAGAVDRRDSPTRRRSELAAAHEQVGAGPSRASRLPYATPGVGWLVVAVVVAVLLTAWVTFTADPPGSAARPGRRRPGGAGRPAGAPRRGAAALVDVAGARAGDPRRRPARDRRGRTALATHRRRPRGGRERRRQGRRTNWPSRQVALAPATPALPELHEAAAGHDRPPFLQRRGPRHAHPAGRSDAAAAAPGGHRELPQFFDIDDTVPTGAAARSATPHRGGTA